MQDVEGFVAEATEVFTVLAEWATDFEDQEQSDLAVERETAVWQVVEMAGDLLGAMLEAMYAQQYALQQQQASRLILPPTNDHLKARRGR